MKSTFLLLLVLFGMIILNYDQIFYFNLFTHSSPFGVYIKIKDSPKRGEYASSCLTDEIARYGIQRHYLEQGSCKTGTVQVLKIIKGLPGDHFIVKNGFLRLNGLSYQIMNKDSSGRGLSLFYKEKNGIIDKNKYMLLSNFVKNSWDCRYWGPVSIQILLKPLWIFDNVKI
jgi:conjugative transfer signal peptidase TraF